MILSIPHLVYSFLDAVVVLVLAVDSLQAKLLAPLRRHRFFRVGEYAITAFGTEHGFALALGEIAWTAADFAAFGGLSRLTWIASSLSVANVAALRPTLNQILHAREVAKATVKGIVGQDKRVLKTPLNLELLGWRPAFDIVNLLFNFGVTIHRDSSLQRLGFTLGPF
jgi:hypothetical protein